MQVAHRGPLATIKRSRVAEAAAFTGTTTGLALKYVVRGREHYRVDGREVSLGAGEVLLLPADTAYSARPGTLCGPTTGICVDFPAPLSLDCPHDFLLGGTFRIGDARLHRLARWQEEPGPLQPADIVALRRETAAFLGYAGTIGDRLGSAASQAVTRRALTQGLLAARAHVLRHFREPLPLADLCRVAGLSQYYFSRLFRRAFGQSPLALQTELRMEAAIALIRQDEMSFTRIAHHLGYGDLAGFSRTFRRYHGVPPSRWKG